MEDVLEPVMQAQQKCEHLWHLASSEELGHSCRHTPQIEVRTNLWTSWLNLPSRWSHYRRW